MPSAVPRELQESLTLQNEAMQASQSRQLQSCFDEENKGDAQKLNQCNENVTDIILYEEKFTPSVHSLNAGAAVNTVDTESVDGESSMVQDPTWNDSTSGVLNTYHRMESDPDSSETGHFIIGDSVWRTCSDDVVMNTEISDNWNQLRLRSRKRFRIMKEDYQCGIDPATIHYNPTMWQLNDGILRKKHTSEAMDTKQLQRLFPNASSTEWTYKASSTTDNSTLLPTKSNASLRILRPRGKPNQMKRRKLKDLRVPVGEDYQATVPKYLSDDMIRDTSARSDIGGGPDQIYDPIRAERAKLAGEKIDEYLAKGRDLNIKMVLMQILHSCNYRVREATSEFIQLYKTNRDFTTTLSDAQNRKFIQYCCGDLIGRNKDFATAAKEIGCRKEAILLNYYRWKSTSRFYKRLKDDRSKCGKFCEICNGGETQIVCDNCHKAYHLGCFTKELEIAPEENWYCIRCTRNSPGKKTADPSAGHDSSKTPGFQQSLAALKSIHKEITSKGCVEDVARHPTEMKSIQMGSSSILALKITPTFPSPNELFRNKEFQRTGYKTHTLHDAKGNNITEVSLASEPYSMNSPYQNPRNCKEHGAKDIESEKPKHLIAFQPQLHTSTSNIMNGCIGKRVICEVGLVKYYQTTIPITSDGLLIKIQMSRRGVIFTNYRQPSGGGKSWAEVNNAFYAVGDLLKSVSGYSCAGKSIEEVLKMLRACSIGKTCICLHMIHDTVFSNEVNSALSKSLQRASFSLQRKHHRDDTPT